LYRFQDRDASMRLRLAYSLRTVIVAMTLAAVGLGWTVHVVRQRRAALDEIRFYATESGHFGGMPSPSSPRVSWIRSLMGDRAIYHIALSNGVSDEELDHYSQLFPEAIVFRLDFSW
jgi:hypothetical protein